MSGNLILRLLLSVICIIYVGSILFIDQYADSINNHNQFRLYFWFIVPLILYLITVYIEEPVKKEAKHWIDPRRISKNDVKLSVGIAIALILAVLSIPLFTDLEAYYLTDPIDPLSWTIWVLAWLPGWELMHRVLLPIHLNRILSNKGWLLIPVFEGVYHLVKPWPETLGMFVFSFILTAWTVYRKNACLPILMHLLIEVFLGFYIYFYFSK